MVMDVGGRIESHLRRTSIKRPWDEDLEPPETPVAGVWHGGRLFLPPIDAVPNRRHSVAGAAHNHYGLDRREYNGGSKRPRFEEHNYSSVREVPYSNGKHQSDGHSIHNAPKGANHVTSFRPPQNLERGNETGGVGGTTGFRDTSDLYQRCKRLTKHQDSECVESFEIMHVELSKLSAKLLQASSDVKVSGQFELNSADLPPPIEQFGLKHTLNWLLGRIHQINDLADKLVQHVQPGNPQQRHRNNSIFGNHDALFDTMKRPLDSELDESRLAINPVEQSPDETYHTRRRSSIFASNEDIRSMRSPRGQHGEHSSMEVHPRRSSIMNPPPAPNRQLPSPPGRSLPSPTSVNFPSPSSASHGTSSTNNLNLPPPTSSHQASSSTYLPPIGSTHSPDALQAHSAALQHEVSVQKIALASLQGEHNKLLAAFSRSQTRASALEKKHQVSDTEIISLTEEKLRLQSQVTDLEKDIEELARSRDEYRQAAVQGGAQYVEMIKKASRLEEMADEERKLWAILKTEMERRIESLAAGSNPSVASHTRQRELDVTTPPSSIDDHSNLKSEAAPEISSFSPDVLDRDLQEEIQRLRDRCAEAEEALRAIRDDSRNMGNIVEALGLTGKSIMERADRTLGALPRA